MPVSKPKDSETSLVIVRLGDLSADLRDAILSARTATGWNEELLRRAVMREFGFLGGFVNAHIDPLPKGAVVDDAVLNLAFTPPRDRDLAAAERAFDVGTRLADRGKVREAVREFARVVAKFPEVAKYHRALGQAHFVLGNVADAEDELLRALTLDPSDAAALVVLGNVYAGQQKSEQALGLYQRAHSLVPEALTASNIGGMHGRLGHHDEAIAAFRDAVALDPEYPNSLYGLALALSNKRDHTLLPEALSALDRALASLGEREASPAIWDAVAGLVQSLAAVFADSLVPAAQRVAEETMASLEAASGLPVQVENQPTPGVLAKIEYGWVHDRPYHRLLVGSPAGRSREHYILHELEHLRLTTLARKAGTNRWFVSTSESRDIAFSAIASDIGKLAKDGYSPTQVSGYAASLVDGILGQLYNFPVDFLIETRLLEMHPHLAELVFVSVSEQLMTASRIAADAGTAARTPKAVYRANTAMNGAFALWLEDTFPGRTDFVSLFQRTATWPLSRRLYGMWSTSANDWSPGAELGWVDEWGEALGLRAWYGWKDDDPTGDLPTSHTIEP